MKRILSSLTALCMSLVFFTACGSGSKDSSESTASLHDTPEHAQQAIYDAYNTHDTDKLMAAALPPELYEAVKNANDGVYEGFTEYLKEWMTSVGEEYGEDATYALSDNVSTSHMDADKLTLWGGPGVEAMYKDYGLEPHQATELVFIGVRAFLKGSKKSNEGQYCMHELNIDGVGWYSSELFGIYDNVKK